MAQTTTRPARVAGDDQPAARLEALMFPLAGDWYALPLVEAREVLPLPDVTPVPGSPPWLVGVANLRGQILPVLDTAASLGLPRPGEVTHLVVVDTSQGLAGLATTGQPERVVLGKSTGSATGRAAVARYAVDSRIATLLDLSQLIEQSGNAARR